jgi:CheY-like chemotaxis protein
MKLDYNIIWVEDKIDTKPFIALKKKVIKHLKDEFFNVSIETAEDFEEFKSKYNGGGTVDLIITDLNLNDNTEGSQVIDFLRDEQHVLTEIFFYSANNAQFNDTKLINSSRITFHQMDDAGAYRELVSSIIKLIDLTISLFQNIITMRGMIMHETSNLDEKSLEIVNEYFENKSDEGIRDALFNEIISFHKEKLGKAERYKKTSNLEKVIGDPLAFSATQRANTLSNIINKEGFVNFIADYKKEILLVRNQFAHAILDEEKQVFRTKKGVEFNEDLCKKIRKDINTHIGNINSLSSQLKDHYKV